MKKTFFLFLLLSSGAANATGTYVLTGYVQAYNAFVPNGANLIGSIAPGGSCTVDISGNVVCAGVQFSTTSAGITFNYTNGSWSTTVGNTSVTHTETCTEAAGTPCTGFKSGLSGLWATGLQNGGAPSNTCPASNFFAAGSCDQVSVTEVEGSYLRIIEQSEFAFPGPSGYIYNFVAVPLPGAAGLLMSALAGLALVRRRRRGHPVGVSP